VVLQRDILADANGDRPIIGINPTLHIHASFVVLLRLSLGEQGKKEVSVSLWPLVTGHHHTNSTLNKKDTENLRAMDGVCLVGD